MSVYAIKYLGLFVLYGSLIEKHEVLRLLCLNIKNIFSVLPLTADQSIIGNINITANLAITPTSS